MRIEKLIAKFNPKGINYEQTGGGKALLSLEEQLSIVGITWNESPVGFLILFVECLNDNEAAKQLLKATKIEANQLMLSWRGTFPEMAIDALCMTAMTEAINPNGVLCSECKGTGVVKSKCRSTVKCPCCTDGLIQWTKEIRFSYFCASVKITFSRFNKYMPVLEKLVTYLQDSRTAAALALHTRVEKEENEARKEFCY